MGGDTRFCIILVCGVAMMFCSFQGDACLRTDRAQTFQKLRSQVHALRRRLPSAVQGTVTPYLRVDWMFLNFSTVLKDMSLPLPCLNILFAAFTGKWKHFRDPPSTKLTYSWLWFLSHVRDPLKYRLPGSTVLRILRISCPRLGILADLLGATGGKHTDGWDYHANEDSEIENQAPACYG